MPDSRPPQLHRVNSCHLRPPSLEPFVLPALGNKRTPFLRHQFQTATEQLCILKLYFKATGQKAPYSLRTREAMRNWLMKTSQGTQGGEWEMAWEQLLTSRSSSPVPGGPQGVVSQGSRSLQRVIVPLANSGTSKVAGPLLWRCYSLALASERRGPGLSYRPEPALSSEMAVMKNS